MPFFDPDSGEVSNVAYAVDTHSIVNNQKSLWDSASDFVTKAVPLTGMAAVNSFINTGVEVDNFFGGDAQKVTIQDEVGDGEFLDQDAQDVKDYYTQHTQGIEAAGLAVGALVPGTLAVKGASIAVKAAWLAKTGLGSEALAEATGLLAPLKARVVANAAEEVASGAAGLFGNLNAQKVAGIALDIGDNALQGMIFSAATAATMHASPLLDDQGIGDAVSDTFYGAVAGGVVGGLLQGIGTVATLTKKLLTADTATKYAELVGRLDSNGINFNNISGGDKVAVILDAADSIELKPGEFAGLAAKKISIGQDQAIQAAKKAIGNIVSKGDEDLINPTLEVVTNIDGQNGMSVRETRAQYLTRLSGIGRYTGEEEETVASGTNDDGTFFINRFAKGESDDFTKLASNSPDPTAQFSEKYALKAGATEVKVARASTQTPGPNGQSVPTFESSKEAFDQGHDLFLNKNLQIIVNPDAPNIEERVALAGMSRTLSKKEATSIQATGQLPEGSKALTGASIVVNKITGAATSGNDAIPVVGDFGKVSLTTTGVTYGEKTSVQDLSTITTSDTAPVDANARYVWADQRGLRKGDVISPNDIPMLEQMYRESSVPGTDFETWKESLAKRDISFSGDGVDMTTPQDLLNHIQNEKNDLLNEYMNKPKADNGTAARLANVPPEYITDGMKATSFKDMTVDPSSYLTPNHVKFTYDIGNTSLAPDGQILRGMLDVQERVKLIKDAAVDAVTKLIGTNYPGAEGQQIATQLIAVKRASDADILGVGAKYLTSSNSKYNSLGQEMEGIGRVLTRLQSNAMARVSTALNPAINGLRSDLTASAEWGNFVNVRQRTASAFQFLPKELAAKYNIPEGTAVLQKSLVKDRAGNIKDWDRTYQPAGFQQGDAAGAEAGLKTFYSLSPKVAAMEEAQRVVNSGRAGARNNWRMAQGLAGNLDCDTLYAPPIDTTKNPFFAYVKMKPGTGMADDGTHVMVASSLEELQTKIATLGPEYSAFTKDQLADFHKAEGDYQYSRNFSQGAVNSGMERQGILNNILPDTNPETLIGHYADWNSKQELGLLRDHVELGNAQLFAELRAMGQRFDDAASSQTGFVNTFIKKTVNNPYDSYVRTALGVSSKESQYPLWQYANEKAEAFFDTAFNAAKSGFAAADKGMISYEEAAKMSEKFGLGNPYATAANALKAYQDVANKLPDPRVLQNFMGKANAVLGSTVIRLDAWQQLIHLTASPIMMLSEAKSALLGLTDGSDPMSKLLRTELPDGSGRTIPAVSKVMFNAIGNFFDQDVRQKWLPIFKGAGIMRDTNIIDEQISAMNNMRFPQGGFSESDLMKNIKVATDFAAKYISGSDASNALLHFMSADMGRQIFEAAGYEGKQLTDNIATFQQRIFGNYVASQRPVAFQGPIGQAVGLFQTYQFNLMQQLFRYVGNHEAKSVAMLAGLQTSLFGLSSMPGFQAINNHIIGNASGNSSHGDIYSAVSSLVDPKLGNYLLYGSLSGVTGVGLYSRGDINPRSITLLPVNPLKFPAIAGGIRFLGAMSDTASRIAQGGGIASSILLGLEHNGLSRPLAGLAQYAQGFATDDKGSLIQAAPKDNTMGLSDLFSAANFSRITGSRPLTEAIAMDASYRSVLYKTKDAERMASLGEAVKSTLYDGGQPTPDQLETFAVQHAKAGGRIEEFNKSMIKWTSEANVGVANKVFNTMRTSGLAKNMMLIMGGQPLPDFRNQGEIAGSGSEKPELSAEGPTP